MTDLQRDIGRHDEAIETLKTEVHAMRQDLADIKRILAGAHGGWKMLVAVGALASALTTGSLKILAMMFKGGG